MIIIECCVDKKDYIAKHGAHFNDRLLEFALQVMKEKHDGFIPYNKEEVDSLLNKYNIEVDATTQDYIYVANMCKADYYGSSVNSEEHLAKFVKDYMGDTDSYNGRTFYRWCLDMKKQGITIDWGTVV